MLFRSKSLLLTEGISKGVPVLYWASEGMKPTHPGVSWTCKDGKTVRWISGTECMLLIGSEPNELVFNDPEKPEGAARYSRMTAVKRHAELDKRAVIVNLN